MENDKAFAVYALLLIAGIGSLITALLVAGIASLPSPIGFAEHVALSLAMRASYKSFAGWDPSEWALTSGRPRRPIAEIAPFPSSEGTDAKAA